MYNQKVELVLNPPLRRQMESIKILIVEHDPYDIELLHHAFKKNGLDYSSLIVETRAEYGDWMKWVKKAEILDKSHNELQRIRA